MGRAGAVLSGLVAAGLWIAPHPPPLSVPPLALPGTSLSPILTEPGPLIRPPAAVAPLPPPALPASPIDSQEINAYRFDLENRERALELQGVSPADPRFREVEQQLQRLREAPGGP